jgi:hypothetical protein
LSRRNEPGDRRECQPGPPYEQCLQGNHDGERVDDEPAATT